MDKRKRIFFIIFVAFVVFVVYFKSIISADFVSDDKACIRDAPVFNSKISVFNVLTAGFDGGFFNRKNSLYYRPFVTLSFYIEKKLIGFNSKSLHFTNLFIYILGIIILYMFLLKQNLKKYSAELIILLFALSPINVDNIMWIVSRYDLFLLLFGFLALYLLDLGIARNKKIYYYLSFGFFVLGVFSKETFLIWLLFFPVYEYIKRRKITVWYHLLNLLTMIGFFFIKYFILKFGSLHLITGKSLFEYFKIGIFTVGTYFKLLFFPVLVPKFYFTEGISLEHYIFTLLFIAFIILILIMIFKKKKEILLPLSLFLISLGPYFLLVFTNLQPFNIYTRYMIIPYFAFLWIVVLIGENIRNKVKISIVIILIILFVYSDLESSSVYRSNVDYWTDAYLFYPENSNILISLADSYYEKGNLIIAEHYLYKALKYAQKEDIITKSNIYKELAFIELAKAYYQKALMWFKKTRKLESLFSYIPENIRMENKLFMEEYYRYRGKYKKSESILLNLKRQAPFNLNLLKLLYDLYCGYEQWDKALEVKKEIREKFPSYLKVSTLKIREGLREMSEREKALFYMKNKNYGFAVRLLERLKEKSDKDYFYMIESYFRIDEGEKANRTIKEFLTKSNTYLSYKKLGFFFLKRMYRVKEALFYFEKSLELNKNQEELVSLINKLKKFNIK